jgi:WD40 repeat protein
MPITLGHGRRAGDIRMYDFATGMLVALLKGHKNSTVLGLAFSPDGKRLISGSFDKTAIIWDVESRQPLQWLRGHTAEINAVGFTSNGAHAVTGSFDTTLKLWSVTDGTEIATLTGHTDKVGALAVSPTDGTIASGSYINGGEIRLWDGDTGRFRRTLAIQGRGIGSLSFSPDGKWLLSSTGNSGDRHVQHVWDMATGREVANYSRHNWNVYASTVSRDGRFAATGGGHNKEIFVWDLLQGDASEAKVLKSIGKTVFSTAFSRDGHLIAWGQTYAKNFPNERGPIESQLGLPSAKQRLKQPHPHSGSATKQMVRTQTTSGALSLAHANGGSTYGYSFDTLEVRKDGKVESRIVRGAPEGYQHQAYSFTPDGHMIISGGNNGTLIAYDLKGAPLGNFVGHKGFVYALTPSPDGRLLLSGSDDQTLCLWNLKTRELIVTFFHGADGEWVMWTPQGYYASSPNGDKIVGWQINRGPDQAGEYVTAAQLRDHFYRPDIIERAITLASATGAVGEASGTSFSINDLLRRQPPAFEIISPENRSHASGSSIEVLLKLEPNAEPVDVIELVVNGRQATTPGLRNATARLAASSTAERRVEVPLEQGENNIRIVARNKVGQTARDFVLFHDKPGLLDKRGTLYVLAIGVDKYAHMPPTCGPDGNQSCDLRYAGKDARAFRDVLVKQVGPLHSEVKALLLARDGDKPPTKANIEDALGEMMGKAGSEDTTVLFIAGHGVTDGRGADYLFMPEEAEPSGVSWRKSTVVPWNLFQTALHNTQGRRLMFADTCHSGGAYNARLVNDAANANIIVFSATDTETSSWELEQLAHGAFTYALIQGLEGRARKKDGSVTVLGLGEFVSDEVTGLTTNKQQPTFHMSGAKNFMLTKQ